MVRTRDDPRQQAKTWDRVRQWWTHKRDRQLEMKLAFKWKYPQDIKLLLENSQKRNPFVRKTWVKQFCVSLSTSYVRQKRTGSSVSSKPANTSTVLLCGVIDAAKGRLRIDQAVDWEGAETGQQRCRMRAFVYRHRSRGSTGYQSREAIS